MGRYVVVHDREHAKAAIESGMLLGELEEQSSRHTLVTTVQRRRRF